MKQFWAAGLSTLLLAIPACADTGNVDIEAQAGSTESPSASPSAVDPQPTPSRSPAPQEDSIPVSEYAYPDPVDHPQHVDSGVLAAMGDKADLLHDLGACLEGNTPSDGVQADIWTSLNRDPGWLSFDAQNYASAWDGARLTRADTFSMAINGAELLTFSGGTSEIDVHSWTARSALHATESGAHSILIDAYPGSTFMVAALFEGGDVAFTFPCGFETHTAPLYEFTLSEDDSTRPSDVLMSVASAPDSELAQRFRAFLEPDEVSWSDLPADRRLLDPEVVPETILAELEHRSFVVRLPDSIARLSENVICTQTSLGWNSCVALNLPTATVWMDGYFIGQEAVRLALLDATGNLVGSTATLGMFTPREGLDTNDIELISGLPEADAITFHEYGVATVEPRRTLSVDVGDFSAYEESFAEQ